MTIEAIDYHLVTDILTDEGNTFNNSYYFKAFSGAAHTAQELNQAFSETIALAWTSIVHQSVSMVRLTAKNLLDETDFDEMPLTGFEGQLTGQYLPDFVCWAFKVNRPSTAVRNGRKSYGRIGENDVEDGQPTAAMQTLLDAFAAEPFPDIQVGTSPVNAYRLAIPKSVLDDDPESPTFGKYVLDALFLATSMSFQRVSTQNSRKVY